MSARLYTDHPLEREDVLYTVNVDEVFDAAWRAWEAVLGAPPTPWQLCIKVSQWILETGWFQVGFHCYNAGNEKTKPDGHEHCYFRCNEIIDGETRWFNPPHLQTCFKAFPTLWQGLVASIQFLAVDTTPLNGRPNRYEQAWAQLMAGDVRGFVRELYAAGYFTADPQKYLAGVEAIARGLLKKYSDYAGPLESVEPEPLPVDDGCREHCPVSDEDLEIVWADMPVPWEAIAEDKRQHYLDLNKQWNEES